MNKPVTWVVLVAGGIVLSGCGTATAPGSGGGAGGSASPAGSATGPASTTPASARSLTETDNGATVRVSTGQTVTVTLSPHGGFRWHVPVASGTALRRVSAAGGYPGKAPARAVFRAEGPGRAVLSSADDIACLHSHPACLLAQRAWRVTVIVAPAQ